MLEFARDNFSNCKENLMRLTKSENHNVRWKIYEVFKVGDIETDEILRMALSRDKDNYSLRRAILSLCDREIDDKVALADSFLEHRDEYIRKAACELRESACKKKL